MYIDTIFLSFFFVSLSDGLQPLFPGFERTSANGSTMHYGLHGKK